MDPSKSPRHQSPQSDLSGQYALKSTLSQLSLQKRNMEVQNQSLTRRVQQLEEELQVERARNARVRTFMRDPEPRSPRQYGLVTHSSNSPSPIELNLGAEAALDLKNIRSTLHSELLENKLIHDQDLKLRMGDLVSTFIQKLAEVADCQVRVDDIDRKISQLEATLNYTESFFSILNHIFVPLYGRTSGSIPSWLSFLLEKSEANTSEMGRVWRLLQWNLHHSSNKKLQTSITQQRVDEWYAMKQEETENVVQDSRKTWAKLHAEMCRDLNILKEPASAGSSPAASSSGSSLSSKIPAEELWKFKTIIQSLVDKYEELFQEVTILRSEAGQDGNDMHDIENDLYLPQKEALETYDLGRLIQTMNSVIEKLSLELAAASAEKKLCQRCRQSLDQGTDQQMMEEKHQSRAKVGHPSEPSGFYPLGAPYVTPGPSYGLQSRQSLGQAAHNIRQPIPVMPASIASAIPKISVRPSMNNSYGVSRMMQPQQVTRIQNANALTRSKSDSSSEVLHRRKSELQNDHPSSRPSSLDSVFSPNDKEARTEPQRSPVQDQASQNLGQSMSDSDEEYEVRGPPDTPPEVRALEGLHVSSSNSLDSPEMQKRHVYQVADGGSLGASEDLETLGPDSYAFTYGRIPDVPYSQVQQCTGDNTSTRQDMLLPSSVDWTTHQLKAGGMQSPTLEGMNRFSSSMHMARQSIADRKCAVCKIDFPESESQAAIFDHIQVHYQRKSPLTSLEDLEADFEADTLRGAASDKQSERTSDNHQEAQEMRCPICQVVFPAYVPLQARNEHINLHLDASISGFEVVKDDYK